MTEKNKPKILKIATVGEDRVSRRELLRRGTAVVDAVAAGATLSTGCNHSEYDIQVSEQGRCLCHVVYLRC